MRWVTASTAVALLAAASAVCAATAPADSRLAAAAEFEAWIAARGSPLAKTRVFLSPHGGFGLQATRHIGPGEDLVTTLASLALTGAPEQHPQLAPALEALDALTPAVQHWSLDLKLLPLTLALVWERYYNPNSTFAPYLRLLPDAQPHNRAFWSEEDAALARTLWEFNMMPPVLPPGVADDVVGRVFAAFPALFGPDTPPARATFRHRFWLNLAIAQTYSFSPRFDGGPFQMVPGVALLNHDRTVAKSHYYVQGDAATNDVFAYGVRSTRGYAPGDEVYLSYGSPCNVDMMLTWGMTEDFPESHCGYLTMMVSVTWDAVQAGGQAAAQYAMTRAIGFQTSARSDDHHWEGVLPVLVTASQTEIPASILAFLRVSVASEDVLRRKGTDTDQWLQPGNPALEAQAVDMLLQLSTQQQQQWMVELHDLVDQLPVDSSRWTQFHRNLYMVAKGRVLALKRFTQLVREAAQQLSAA